MQEDRKYVVYILGLAFEGKIITVKNNWKALR